MSDAAGWIKLDKGIMEHPVATTLPMLAVWITLLTRATWKEKQAFFAGKPIKLQPGQAILTRVELAKITKLSEDVVRTAIRKLNETQSITQRSSSTSTLYTVVNWDRYQLNPQPIPNRSPTDPQPIPNRSPTTNSKKRRTEEEKIVPPIAPQGGRESEFFKRVSQWFRPGRKWSAKELAKLKAVAALETSEEDLSALEARYTSLDPETVQFRRREPYTLLNNWAGEIDKSHAWQAERLSPRMRNGNLGIPTTDDHPF